MMFVLSRKWCWSILALFAILVVFPYLLVTYDMADNLIRSNGRTMNRSSWGALSAKPGLDILNTPILKIIVTQTFDGHDKTSRDNEAEPRQIRIDEPSSCTTEVESNILKSQNKIENN